MSRLDIARALTLQPAATTPKAQNAELVATSQMQLGEAVSSGEGYVSVLMDGSDPKADDVLVECQSDEDITPGTRVTVISSDGNYKAIALSPETTGVGEAIETADAARESAEQAAADAAQAAQDAREAMEAAQKAGDAHFWSDSTGAYVSSAEGSKSGGYVHIDTDSVDVCMDDKVLVSMYQLAGGYGTGVRGVGDTAFTGEGNAYITTAEALDGGKDIGIGVNHIPAGGGLPDGETSPIETDVIAANGDFYLNGKKLVGGGSDDVLGAAVYFDNLGGSAQSISTTGTGTLFAAKFPQWIAQGATFAEINESGTVTVKVPGLYRVTAQIAVYMPSNYTTSRVTMRAMKGSAPSGASVTYNSDNALHTNVQTCHFTGNGASYVLYVRDDFAAWFEAGDKFWFGASSSASGVTLYPTNYWALVQRVW